MERRSLKSLQEVLGYRFEDSRLLLEALTHRSALSEKLTATSYERLEFLGDAVLGLICTVWLFERFPDYAEGELTRRKSWLVSSTILAEHAERLGVGDCLILGVGEERSGGRLKPSLLADALEAILGGIFLDGGFSAANRTIRALLETDLGEAELDPPLVEAKNRLQERVQGSGLGLPVYSLDGEEGPDHAKVFTVEVTVEGEVLGTGRGNSKKLAEQRAAVVALERLDDE